MVEKALGVEGDDILYGEDPESGLAASWQPLLPHISVGTSHFQGYTPHEWHSHGNHLSKLLPALCLPVDINTPMVAVSTQR